MSCNVAAAVLWDKPLTNQKRKCENKQTKGEKSQICRYTKNYRVGYKHVQNIYSGVTDAIWRVYEVCSIILHYSSAFRHHVSHFYSHWFFVKCTSVKRPNNEWVWTWPERVGSCCFGFSVIIWTDYNSSCFLADLSRVAGCARNASFTTFHFQTAEKRVHRPAELQRNVWIDCQKIVY